MFDANYEDANLDEDSDEDPLRLKVCVRLRMKQDSKSPCSSKAAASRESNAGNWIQSGTVTASILQFTLHRSWHIFGCVFAWRR